VVLELTIFGLQQDATREVPRWERLDDYLKAANQRVNGIEV
jgi:hypothetical protein